MQFLAILIFIPLQLLWLPLSIIGGATVAYRQLVVSRRMGVSQTAVEIINGRWAMDVFGLRGDGASRKLAGAIPNNSVLGLWLTLFPIWLISKAFRRPFLYPTLPAPENARLANLVPSRTVIFDALIEGSARSCTQLTILGAGLDTRAYGAFRQGDLAIYEVDEAAEQAYKLAALARAGIDASQVHFVQADFGKRDWTNALLASDYDREKPTIFLWEGVTLYLSRQAVENTLASLKRIAPADSVVLADIYSQRFINLTKTKALGWSLEMTGEEMRFGLDFSADPEGALKDFVESNDVRLAQCQFLGGQNKHGPFVTIAKLAL